MKGGGACWGRGEQGGRENEVVTCLLLLLQHIEPKDIVVDKS